ncbi:MAG: DUF1850 domain-containing protein [Fulvimarina manganoxydans]|uniref:DUF1850 domain-containing protein n=1 Tax=Fulvimarina manganoxydans TaxID=937218 RepID=UPI0023557982|nr:DUF1850 domain-containing protein [Fulvimarina manganoxydans]MCK5931595.1 DUF1850 domain-containing protein [Fulvimarina manganoxydans]
MRPSLIVVAAAFFWAAAAAGAASPVDPGEAGRTQNAQHLVIAEAETPLLCFPVQAGDRFTLSWVHSVEMEDWQEVFEIEADGSVEVVATRFKTFGAGVPADAGQTTRLEDGWVVMEGIDRDVDPLAILATPRQKYRLSLAGRTLSLTPDGQPHLLTFRMTSDQPPANCTDADPSSATAPLQR